MLVVPEEVVQLGAVVRRPEAAEQHEVLWRRDGGDRVELQITETPHGIEDAGRAAVEELGADGDAARFVARDLDGSAGHGLTLPRRAMVREAAGGISPRPTWSNGSQVNQGHTPTPSKPGNRVSTL